MELDVYKLPGGETDNERCLMCTLRIGETELLVTADAGAETERRLVQTAELSGTDVLIVGHHGSQYSSCGELLSALSGRTAASAERRDTSAITPSTSLCPPEESPCSPA